MDPVIVSVQCLEYDPRQVAITVQGPGGLNYSVIVLREQYKVLAMLPGFPPDPCGD